MLPIGGFPDENQKDRVEIADNIKGNLEIKAVKWIDEVLELALTSRPAPTPATVRSRRSRRDFPQRCARSSKSPAIESLNASVRKAMRNKGRFSTDQSVAELIWLALRDITENWKNPPILRHAAKAQLTIQFWRPMGAERMNT